MKAEVIYAPHLHQLLSERFPDIKIINGKVEMNGSLTLEVSQGAQAEHLIIAPGCWVAVKTIR